MEVRVFSEWLRSQWDDDAMPVGVPTRPVKVPKSEEMDDVESFHQFLVHYRHEIRSGRQLLPNGATYELNMMGSSYDTFDPPDDVKTRMSFSKLFYSMKLRDLRGNLKDLSDAVMGLSDETLQGELRQWAVPYRFTWPVDELGTAPQDRTDQGDYCAIAAKKRLKAIAKFYQSKCDKLEAEYAKLPSVVAQEDSSRIKEHMDREAREAEMNYRAAFSKV